MSEKVKLPKDVCDALDKVFDVGYSPSQIISTCYHQVFPIDEWAVLNEQIADVLMRALVLGYEPELSAEDELKNFYKKHQKVGEYFDGVQKGIEETLRIHGIHYDWMEDAE